MMASGDSSSLGEIHVKLCLTEDLMDSLEGDSEGKTDLGAYNIRQPKYGKVIIINIKEFYIQGVYQKEHTRIGSSEDVQNLVKAFGEDNLGMDVSPPHEGKITADDFTDILENLANEDYKEYDMIFLIVMSHGNGIEIFTSHVEMTIKITDIVSTFDKTPSLENKPKIFIFQGCRGNLINWIPNPQINSSQIGDIKIDLAYYEVRKLTDCLIVQSTISGFGARRDESTGSWLIKSLCQVLNEDWQSCEICTLLTRVNQVITMRTGPAFDNDQKLIKQMSTFTSMLTKKLYILKRGNNKVSGKETIGFHNLKISDKTEPPLQVPNGFEFYKLDSPKLGKAVLINIDTFYNDEDNLDESLTRDGYGNDVETLTSVFKAMGMDFTDSPLETTFEEIIRFINKCADDNYNDYAMFLCIFMSYGNGNAFYASKYNGKINMDEIVHRIDKSIGLQNKPKIFIFQDCRSDKFPCYDNVTSVPKRIHDTDITEPRLADCLIIKSSPPDYLLRNDAKDAPCYINVLSNVLGKYWKQEEICTMLTRVNSEMAGSLETGNETLTSSFKSMLRKKLFFSEEASRVYNQ